MRLPDWIARRALTHPSQIAVEAPDAALTYRELDTRVGRAAAALRALGAIDGARVALLAEPNAAFAIAVHAVARAGAVLVPLNTRLTDAERRWQLQDCDATLLLSGEEGSDHLRQVTLDEGLWSGRASFDGSEPQAGAPCCLIYSSGTTGRPKADVLTHGNIYWSAIGSAENLGVEPNDRWLACMPLFHVGGLSILARSAIYGTTAVIQAPFEPTDVARALGAGRISLLSVVPTMLSRLLALPELAAPQLRAVLVGGGAASPALLTAARERGLPVLATFGLSEAASQVTTQRLDASPVEGSSGPAMAVTTLRVDIDGSRADAGEVGDLLVAGPTVMARYHGRDAESTQALADGWLRTGDYGCVDAAAELHVVDRRDDLIVSGGENIYPSEVEQTLETHPDVAECVVVGLPDEEFGQRVTAVIVPIGIAPTSEQLDAHVRATLAGYKAPRRYDFVSDPLPRTALGKLRRAEMRAQLEAAP